VMPEEVFAQLLRVPAIPLAAYVDDERALAELPLD
jgi:hypothetical protein